MKKLILTLLALVAFAGVYAQSHNSNTGIAQGTGDPNVIYPTRNADYVQVFKNEATGDLWLYDETRAAADKWYNFTALATSGGTITAVSLQPGNILRITESGVDNDVDLSALAPLTEAQVDAFVANNGYLTAEVDGSVTNETITSLNLNGTTLEVTEGGVQTDIDLVGLQDGTGTDSQNLGAAAGEITISGGTNVAIETVLDLAPGPFANDGAAATGGVAIGETYRLSQPINDYADGSKYRERLN